MEEKDNIKQGVLNGDIALNVEYLTEMKFNGQEYVVKIQEYPKSTIVYSGDNFDVAFSFFMGE